MRTIPLFLMLVLMVLALLVGVPAAAADPAPMRAPLPGTLQVVAPFAAPPNRFGAGHRGVDLAGATGTAVLAPADGVVVYAGRLVDRGVLSIDHTGGARSSFEPVTASVTVGQRVVAGQVVAVLDAGHPRCAPVVCLHWGVRVNGEYMDPMLLLAPLHVRLLPWDG